MLYSNLVIPRKNLRNKFTTMILDLIDGEKVMQNQVYRGIFHSGNSDPSDIYLNKIALIYRGLYFIKSSYKKDIKNKHQLNYRGTSYTKCVGWVWGKSWGAI